MAKIKRVNEMNTSVSLENSKKLLDLDNLIKLEIEKLELLKDHKTGIIQKFEPEESELLHIDDLIATQVEKIELLKLHKKGVIQSF